MRTWIPYLLLAILSCLLCPKQQCKADEQQHVADSLVQTGNSGKPSPSSNDKSIIPPHQIESSREENRTYGQKPQTDWCEVAVKAVVGNWPLIIIYIIGTCAAISTLRAFVIQIKQINRQTVATRLSAEASMASVKLQHTAMQQWIVINNWKARFDDRTDRQNSLIVEFDISNPSSFPLTLEKFEILFRLPGCIRTSLIDPDLPPFRLCPKLPETIPIYIPMESKEAAEQFRTTGLNIGVEVDVIHTDIGPNGKTPFHAQGYINCQNGRSGWKAEFHSSAFRPPEGDEKQNT